MHHRAGYSVGVQRSSLLADLGPSLPWSILARAALLPVLGIVTLQTGRLGAWPCLEPESGLQCSLPHQG